MASGLLLTEAGGAGGVAVAAGPAGAPAPIIPDAIPAAGDITPGAVGPVENTMPVDIFSSDRGNGCPLPLSPGRTPRYGAYSIARTRLPAQTTHYMAWG